MGSEVINQKSFHNQQKATFRQMKACNGSSTARGTSSFAEPYPAHRYVAAALAPRTYPDQRQKCQVDLGRQHCVHEPAIAPQVLLYVGKQ